MSNKIIHTAERNVQVGIWDNCTDVIRVYADRTVAHLNSVRWVNNSGSLHTEKTRITGKRHADILAALNDDAPDTAWELVYDI